MRSETPLVIVTGPPASGKTTIARALAHELRLPLLARDDLKELLYDVLGTGDVEWSRKLGVASFALLYHLVEVELRAARSCVVEANFWIDDGTRAFRGLHERFPFRALQFALQTEPDVLVARYLERVPHRHVGHVDFGREHELRERIRGGVHGPLGVPGETLVVDTTSFGDVDLAALAVRARRWLED